MGLIKKIVRKLFDFGMLSMSFQQSDYILRRVARLNAIAYLHQRTFAEFKNCHEEQNVVIVGAGPSVTHFKPIDNCKYIALNSGCRLQTVEFDYFFAIDNVGINKIYDDIRSLNCIKFVGDCNIRERQIPETEIQKWNNVRRYATNVDLYSDSNSFTVNIESEPIISYNTVALQAIQFALYTHPKRIYLVGIDCSSNGHFDVKQGNNEELKKQELDLGFSIKDWTAEATKYWYLLKQFVDIYFPEIEIISVNPVGLRGLFKDLDQD